MDARPSPETMIVVDPATGSESARHPVTGERERETLLEQAQAAQLGWDALGFDGRGRVLRQAAALLRERVAAYAELMTAEMGKTRLDGEAELAKCAAACDFFAADAASFLAEQPVAFDPGEEAFVTFRPLGVLLAVMPWNFPFWQAIRGAAPALMAGNVLVLKHASNVPGCALALASLFRDAGAPEGVFTSLLVPSGAVAELIAHPAIDAVTLTGSVAAGRAVAAAAGGALKKCVLELGGSDPYVLLEDVDIPAAARLVAKARMVNGGQSCIAGKRAIVPESIAEPFEEALAACMADYQLGDPRDPDTCLGPMVSVKARDTLHAQVEASVARGARLRLGGDIPDRPGAWYPATMLTNVAPGMPAYDDELFGPVAAVIRAVDEEDAIRIANDTRFGLGACVLTRDRARGRAIAAERLDAGLAFVNRNVRSDMRLPFGGVKDSGFGRELSAYGICEFVNIKSVVVSDHPRQTSHEATGAVE